MKASSTIFILCCLVAAIPARGKTNELYRAEMNPAAFFIDILRQPVENLRVGGVAAGDMVFYDSSNHRDTGPRVGRAVIRLDYFTGQDIQIRLAPDLVGRDTLYGLEEAWLAYSPTEFARITAGLVKIPLGVEHSINQEDLSFVGYAFPTYLDGRTDLGLRIEQEFAEGLFSYDLAAVAGEGFDQNGQSRGEPQFSLRLVSYPFRSFDGRFQVGRYEVPLFQGLFGGIAVAYSPGYESELDVTNPLRNKIFNTPGLDADEAFFYHVSWGLDAGPFRLLHEFERGSLFGLETPDGGDVDLDNQITAWAGTFSWMLTGEHYDSRPFRQREGRLDDFPARPFRDPEHPGPGALELAARFSNADIDRDFFTLGFTSYDESSQEFRSFSGALNWYPTHETRVTFQVVRTIADQDPQVFDPGGRDTSYVLRGQVIF